MAYMPERKCFMSNNTNTNNNNTQNIKEENTMNTYAPTEIKDILNTTTRFIGNIFDLNEASMQKHHLCQ